MTTTSGQRLRPPDNFSQNQQKPILHKNQYVSYRLLKSSFSLKIGASLKLDVFLETLSVFIVGITFWTMAAMKTSTVVVSGISKIKLPEKTPTKKTTAKTALIITLIVR